MTCANCHHVNREGSQFCEKCGQPIEMQSKTLNLEKVSLPPQKRSSKKGLFVVLGLLVVLGAVVIALVLTVPNYNKLQQSLDKVKNGKDFYELLTVGEVSEIEEKAQIKYWERNVAPVVQMGLTALRGKSADTLQVVDEPLKITRTKKFGVFDYYTITPIPVEVEGTTNVEPVMIMLKGKQTELLEDDEVELGEFLPGIYSYHVVWNSPNGKVKEERTFTTDDEVLRANFDFYTVGVPDTDGKDVRYLVDGEPLSDELVMANQLTVPTQEAFTLQAVFEEQGETHKSEIIEITNDLTDVTFTYPTYNNTAKAEEEAKATILRYLNLYTAGASNRLGEVISANSAFLDSQTKYLSGLNKQGISVNLMSYDVLSFQELGNDSYRLNVNETFVVNEPGKYSKTVKQNVTYDITNFGGDFLITNYQLNKK